MKILWKFYAYVSCFINVEKEKGNRCFVKLLIEFRLIICFLLEQQLVRQTIN